LLLQCTSMLQQKVLSFLLQSIFGFL
jgi:hypothetical protein